ncbi:HAD family hydrolase [Hafnia psychrotolerans]|uniref:HAD family hydrolase n=1 Tax=Hafnia psychrotolerans TaxID=1477018 RepID=A0ABQ1GJ08_9GAMM|nr:HAD family hydrolase [Hafnia psychrotolerans]GGA44585.1 hypothetical protein GCM10011328_19600 [Hafnia psychrotolerans]
MEIEHKYPGIIFDLYSTLVFEDRNNAFYKKMLNNLNLNKEFMTVYKETGRDSMSGNVDGMVERISLACQRSYVDISHKKISDFVDKNIHLFNNSVHLYNDTITTLQTLRDYGYQLSMISNASSYTKPIIRKLKINKYLDEITLSCDVKTMKPDSSIYFKHCVKIKHSPSSCIYVGDGGDNELLGAKNLGMLTIIIDRELPHTKLAKESADFHLHNLSQLPEVVNQLNK